MKRTTSPDKDHPTKRASLAPGLERTDTIIPEIQLRPNQDETAGLETAVENLALSEEEDRLRRSIEDLAKGTPRFLFRYWSARSGGKSALNTIDQITPRAFLNRKGPEALHKMQLRDVRSLAGGHISGDRVETVFSSWTQSFPVVLSYARASALRGDKTTHISMLDTCKVDHSNVILHTSDMNRLCYYGGRPHRYEYLIFGVIKGPALRAVPYHVFEPPNVLRRGPALHHILRQRNVERRVDMINQIAQRYGSHLEMPVAAHMMAFMIIEGKDERRRSDYLTKMSANMPIPPEWKFDPTIMQPDVEYHGYIECYIADNLIKEMVIMKHGKPEQEPATSEHKETSSTTSIESQPKRSNKPTPAEAQKAVESVTSSPRVPEAVKKAYRMVTELYTTMKGYEAVNREIEKFKEKNA